MPYCANCGTEVIKEARFCSECGYLLNSRNQAASNDLDGIKDSPSGFEQHKTDQDFYNEGKKHLTSRATKKTPRARPQKKAIILPLLLVVVMLALGTIIFILTGEETYSASGRVVNYAGEGIAGVTINFGEDFGTAKTDENGYWSKSDLQGEITVTPQYGNVLFNPIRSEISKAEDEVNFALLKEVDKGITSSAGEYVFSSHLTAAEEVEITVIVDDHETGEKLEGIDVEVVVGVDTIEIFLQDDEGFYLPTIIVLEMERLEEYPGVEVKSGSLLVSIRTRLLSNNYLQWAIQNPREASADVALSIAVGLDVAGLLSYTAGGIAIMTAPATAGLSAVPGAGAIAAGFAMTIVSEFFKVYAADVYSGIEKTEHSVTIYIYESHESASHAKLLVPVGTSIDEIIKAVDSKVGDREYEIIAPETNPAGAYYNNDGTPKFFYIYLKYPKSELAIELEAEPELEVIVNVDVLHLKSGPSTEHDILDRLMLGTLLQVIGSDNEWVQVITPDGKEGWVHGDYVISHDSTETKEISIQERDPYSAGHEFGLETIGIRHGMAIEEVIEILGEPHKIEKKEYGRFGPSTDLIYEGLELYFFNLPEPTDSFLGGYIIYSPEIVGKRGISIGDTAESVIEKYLQEYDRKTNDYPKLAGLDSTLYPTELYYIDVGDGTAKYGLYFRKENTDQIVSIQYWHGLPYSDDNSCVIYTIENGLVKEIFKQ